MSSNVEEEKQDVHQLPQLESFSLVIVWSSQILLSQKRIFFQDLHKGVNFHINVTN